MKPECTNCRERFSDYLDGLLAEPERAEVDAHLAACAECRRELDLWRATVQAVGELPRHGAPQGFGARVMQGLDAEGAQAPRRQQMRSLWLRALPVAAMLLVVIGVVVIVHRGGAPAPSETPSPSGAPVRLAERIAPPAATEAPAAMAAPAAPVGAAGPAATAPAAVAAPAAATAPAAAYGVSAGAPVAPAEARRAGVAGGMAFAMRKPAADEAAMEASATRQSGMEAATGMAAGGAPAEKGLRATMDLKDQTVARPEAVALALPPARDGTLVFQQTAVRPEVTQPPHQVLTMRAKDPTDLIRRAVKVANEQGLEVTLVLKPNDQADISIQVPADRYDALVAALVDLTAPQSQAMSNTSYAQSDFYRQALVNYNALNSNRLEQQKTQLAQTPAATDRLLEAAGKESASEAEAVAAPVANGPAMPAARQAGGTSGPAPAAARPQEAAAMMASQMRAMPQATAKSAAATPALEEAKKEVAAPGPPQVVNLQITILRAP